MGALSYCWSGAGGSLLNLSGTGAIDFLIYQVNVTQGIDMNGALFHELNVRLQTSSALGASATINMGISN